jgi:hypothetical protein
MVSNTHIVTDKTSTEKWLADNSIAFEVRTPKSTYKCCRQSATNQL